jgi:hypothetical protein
MHRAIPALRNLGYTLALAAPLAALARSQSPTPSPLPSPIRAQTSAQTTAQDSVPQPFRLQQAQLDLPDAPSYSAAYRASVDTSADTSTGIPTDAATSSSIPHSLPIQGDPAPQEQYAPNRPAASTRSQLFSLSEPLRTQPARRYDKYIDFTEIAAPLTARDKFVLSLRATVTPWAFTSIATAAGFEHLRNSSPRYGTNSEAFGQRVGAAAARGSSQLILGDGLLAPLLHEDPRYYQLGEQHRVWARAGYAVSRVFVTRSDQGQPTPHLSLLLGNAAAIALSNTYYPDVDRNAKQALSNYAGSLAGAAFSFVVREFLDQALYSLHMRDQ